MDLEGEFGQLRQVAQQGFLGHEFGCEGFERLPDFGGDRSVFGLGVLAKIVTLV